MAGAVVACIAVWGATRFAIARRSDAAALAALPPWWGLALAALAPALSRPEVFPIAAAIGALNGVSAATDAAQRLIFNVTLILASIALVPLAVLEHGWIYCAVGGFVALALCSVAYRIGALPAGDWKLVGLVGLALGPRQVLLAVSIGVAVLGMWVLILRSFGRPTSGLAFAPAMALGSSCALMVR
jgi:Flp pilus assembly protein protease CpaA